MDRQKAILLLDQPAELDMRVVARAVKARYPALPANAVVKLKQSEEYAP